jgi:hypothetical protein
MTTEQNSMRDKIREIFLAHGFEIKPGHDDLKPYVYEAAEALIAAIAATKQEPVAWYIDWPDEPELGHYFAEEPSEMGRNRPLVFGDAAPQPAQPAPTLCESKAAESEGQAVLSSTDERKAQPTPVPAERKLTAHQVAEIADGLPLSRLWVDKSELSMPIIDGGNYWVTDDITAIVNAALSNVAAQPAQQPEEKTYAFGQTAFERMRMTLELIALKDTACAPETEAAGVLREIGFWKKEQQPEQEG